jgi:hypothetical protein
MRRGHEPRRIGNGGFSFAIFAPLRENVARKGAKIVKNSRGFAALSAGHLTSFAVSLFLRIIAALFFAWASVTLLAGCSGDLRGPGDPLFGGYTPRPGLAAAVPPGPLPPLPAPNSTASNAALASAPLRPLDGRHDLRIASPGNVSAAAPGGGPPNPQATEFTPVANPFPRSGPGASDDSKITTYEQAQARLTARGVTWQRLETTGAQGEWQFSCSLPNRQNPSISHTYQAQGHDPLAAIKAVLEQIDREQR